MRVFRAGLVAVGIWFAASYIRQNTYERVTAGYPALERGENEGEVYGIGIEKGSSGIFWFHEKTE
ncbi:MAG: hypothetical protein HFE84_01255 [Lachnospiraceae bacterium]|nr:hypothetical protein [Lachnospiraceae bacterium]